MKTSTIVKLNANPFSLDHFPDLDQTQGLNRDQNLIALIRDMLKDYPDGSVEGLKAYKRLEEILKGG